MSEPKPFHIYLKSRKLDDCCKWATELMAILRMWITRNRLASRMSVVHQVVEYKEI